MNDKLKEKILKVLELAKRGGTEAEADTAMKLASELLMKHNMSMSDITSNEVEEEDIISDTNDCDNRQPWQNRIYYSVATLYFCQGYSKTYELNGKQYNSAVIVGRESNVQTAKEIASYLVWFAKNECNNSGQDRSWKNSFYKGFAGRISGRCRDARAQTVTKITHEVKERGLVVVDMYALRKRETDDFLKTKGIRLVSGGRGSGASNGDGYNAGREAGNRASMNKSNTLKIGN